MNCKLLLVIVAVIALTESVKWRGYDDDGNRVQRTVRVMRAPPAFPYTFEGRAVERTARKGRKASEVDAIDFLFSVNNVPRFTVRHFQRDEDGAEKRAARHGLRKLIEYLENGDPNSGFNPENDTIVQSWYLWGQNWTVLSVQTRDIEGSTVTTVCSHTTNNVVEICVYFTDIVASLTVNGSAFMLNNNAIHHSMRISNFPWIRSDSKLALKVHFESRTRVREFGTAETGGAEDAAELVGDEGDSIRPVVAWTKSVSLTGCSSATGTVVKDKYRDREFTADVDINKPNGDSAEISFALSEHITYFSFLTGNCQPTSIFWDPEIGIQDDSSSSLSLLPSLLALFTLLAYFLF